MLVKDRRVSGQDSRIHNLPVNGLSDFISSNKMSNQYLLCCLRVFRKMMKDGKTMCIKRDVEEMSKFVKEKGPACTSKEVNQWTSPRFPFEFELV